MRPRSGWTGGLGWLLLAAAAILPYLPALWAGYAFDDGGLILENAAVRSDRAAAAWTTPYWPGHPGSGLYRPWVTFSYWLNARFTGAGAAGFHAMNILIHVGVVLALWRLLRRLFPDRGGVTFGTALVFALHPLHSEAVTAIVGRAETWAALWGLLAYHAALEPSPLEAASRGSARRSQPVWRLPLSVGCFLLALLSKESSAGLLALPAIHFLRPLAPSERPGTEAAHARRRHWLRVGIAWSLGLLLVLLQRRAILGAIVGLERPSLSDNVLASSPAFTRILSALGFQWILLGRTLFPRTLTADFSYPQLTPSGAWMAAGAGLLALGAWAAIWAWRRRDREVLWGLTLILAAGAVTANVLLPVGTVLAERLTYLPSAGLLWLGGIGLSRLLAPPRVAAGPRRFALILLAVWGLFLAGRTVRRNFDWHGDLRLFAATTQASPRSAKAWSNLAVAQLKAGSLEESLRSSARALELLPGYPGALEIRATALTQSGRPAEAVPLLRAALRDPRPRPRSLVELGNAFLALGEGTPAESAFVAATRVAPSDDFHPVVGLASAYALQKRWPESEANWRRAARLVPGNPDVQRSWAYALWQAGSGEEAERIYRTLLAASPEDAAACNDFAWYLLEARGATEAALSYARRAFTSRPDGTTGDTLLEALRRARGCDAAAVWCDSLRRSGCPESILDPLETALQERCKGAPKKVG